MNWLSPQWLWLLLPLLALILYRRQQDSMSWNFQHAWLIVAMLLVIAALCRPVLEKEPVEAEQTGSDIIVAIDLSYSMQAADVGQSRLKEAKRLLGELVSRNTRDRFGVIGFTTNAIVLSPLTNDGPLLMHLFEGLDESMILTKGTQIAPALELARRMSASRRPIVLLMSDGGDALNYSDERIYAKQHDLVVNVILLGTETGSTLPQLDGTLLKDEKGQIVVTALNRAVEILAVNGGKVVENPQAGEILSLLEDQKNADYRSKTKVMAYEELFYYFVGLAIVALMLGFTTLGKRTQRWILPLLMMLGLNAEAGVMDYYYQYQGREAYEKGAYEEAADYYRQVDTEQAVFNAANSFYHAGQYEKALQYYKMLRFDHAADQAALLFNQANCYIRLQEFEQAKSLLRQSLIIHQDREALENLYAISRAEEQDHMLTGRQEGKKRDQSSAAESSAKEQKKKKSGGSSNMDVAASSSSGSSEGGKKVKSDPRLDFSTGKGRLSSTQYELINKRNIRETKPW